MNTQQIMSFVKIAQELNQSNHVAIKGMLKTGSDGQIGPAQQPQNASERQASIDMIQQRSTLIHSLLDHLHQRLYETQHSAPQSNDNLNPAFPSIETSGTQIQAHSQPIRHRSMSNSAINSSDLSQLALTCLHLLKKMDFDFAHLLQDLAQQLETAEASKTPQQSSANATAIEATEATTPPASNAQ